MSFSVLYDTSRIVGTPGPFLGEPLYVRDYWNAATDGLADFDGYAGETLISCFELTSEDYGIHAALRGVAVLALWADADGFVHHRAMNATEYETFKRAWNATYTDESR